MRIFQFTTGPTDWQQLLADPVKHWRTGFSARTLAYSWESSHGFPQEVASIFETATDQRLAKLTPLLGVPEFKVPLPGGARPSQSDIFVLARTQDSKPVVIMVEGKVEESFGDRIEQWLSNASPGKEERLKFLTEKLALEIKVPTSVRYQLLHRAASAILTGEQYRAEAAVLLVHSFSTAQPQTGWTDFADFLRLFDVTAEQGVLQLLSSRTSIPLYAAWARGDVRFLSA